VKKAIKRLSLRPETVRQLSAHALPVVRGGLFGTATQGGVGDCPTVGGCGGGGGPGSGNPGCVITGAVC
jgi:hypothetical protein